MFQSNSFLSSLYMLHAKFNQTQTQNPPITSMYWFIPVISLRNFVEIWRIHLFYLYYFQYNEFKGLMLKPFIKNSNNPEAKLNKKKKVV